MRRYLRRCNLEDGDRPELDFVGSILGPGIRSFSESFETFKRKYAMEHSGAIRGGVATVSRRREEYMDLSLIRDSQKLPRVIAAAGFGEFFGAQFLDRHVKTRWFDCIPTPQKRHPLFAGLTLEDPLGAFHIYGACAYTMLVDTRKLEGAPLPERWEDLLRPCYRGQIVMGFTIDDLNENILIYLYQKFGKEGLLDFCDNLAVPMTTIDMMRFSVDRNNRNAIYLMPHFFTAAAPREPYLQKVWPKDGAFLCPLYFLAHDIEREPVRAIVDYLQGEVLGEDLASRYFQHTHPNVWNRAPEDATFQWLGWDFIYEKNIMERMYEIDSIVVPALIKKYPFLKAEQGKSEWNG